MHRYLYQVHSEDNTSDIQQATKWFRQALISSPPNTETPNYMVSDVIAEYLIDIKLYSRSEYQPDKAKSLFQLTTSLSTPMVRYIQDTFLPFIQQDKERTEQEYQIKLQEYRQLYQQDSDYPIYVRFLGAREKRDKRIRDIQQAQDAAEWLITTNSSLVPLSTSGERV